MHLVFLVGMTHECVPGIFVLCICVGGFVCCVRVSVLCYECQKSCICVCGLVLFVVDRKQGRNEDVASLTHRVNSRLIMKKISYILTVGSYTCMIISSTSIIDGTCSFSLSFFLSIRSCFSTWNL